MSIEYSSNVHRMFIECLAPTSGQTNDNKLTDKQVDFTVLSTEYVLQTVTVCVTESMNDNRLSLI